MEPISMALLGALAGGLGGEAGKQAWNGLGALVRRPFRRTDGSPVVTLGETELAMLQADADDLERRHALSSTLAVRAALDPAFGADLRHWHEEAKAVDLSRTGDGEVTNTILGGTFHAQVHQGRDFTGTTVNVAPSVSAPPASRTPETASDPVPPQD